MEVHFEGSCVGPNGARVERHPARSGAAARPRNCQVPRVVVGGVSALMFNEASNGRAAALPKLLPDMMYLAVTPYFGHEQGVEAMNGTVVGQ